MRLAGKVAVVTGGGRGIGRAIAEAMSAEGASLVIGDVSSESAEEAAAAICAQGGSAVAVTVDVAVRAEVEGLADAAEQAFGTPTVVFCSAGITSGGGPMTFLELSDHEWDRVVDVNLRGTFLVSQIIARRMVAAKLGGSIITVSSIGASTDVRRTAYHTSKAAISGLTRALAVNLAHFGIRANGLAPGYIMTDMMRVFSTTTGTRPFAPASRTDGSATRAISRAPRSTSPAL